MGRGFYVACICGAAAGAQAFDTGTHNEVTSAATADLGFGVFAVDTARLENFLVDYFTNDPVFPDAAYCKLMHFDNLTGATPEAQSRELRVYWGHFTNNMRREIQRLARSNSPNAPFDAVCLLGMSLHSLQDFYTHSNWVETHPAPVNSYRTDTWFTNTPGPNDTSVYTGRYPGGDPNNPADNAIFHGSYEWGMNHDNFNRTGWDRALVFAYSGTVQWVQAVKRWADQVNPTFFKKMQTLNIPSLRTALDSNLVDMYRLSEWTANGSDADGRWKAKGSGQILQFVPLGVRFSTYWLAGGDAFTDAFVGTKLQRLLSLNLDNLSGLIPSYQPLPRPTLNRRAIYLRTLTAADTTPFGGADGPFGNADFFAIHTIQDQRFIETMRPDTNSGPVDWLTVKLVSVNRPSVRMTYQLWDEDVTVSTVLGYIGTDEQVDVNPANGNMTLSFDFDVATHELSGDITGVHDSIGTAVTIAGNEGVRGTISLYVTEYAVTNP